MDFRIEWDDSGWERAKKELLSGALEEARTRARRAVQGFRCPDHNQAVRFVAEHRSAGRDLESIGRIEACCDKAAKRGQAAFDRALR